MRLLDSNTLYKIIDRTLHTFLVTVPRRMLQKGESLRRVAYPTLARPLHPMCLILGTHLQQENISPLAHLGTGMFDHPYQTHQMNNRQRLASVLNLSLGNHTTSATIELALLPSNRHLLNHRCITLPHNDSQHPSQITSDLLDRVKLWNLVVECIMLVTAHPF